MKISLLIISYQPDNEHDDVIKWKHFPRYWTFVRGIQRSTVNFPHKGQWRGVLMFTLICARINGWVNNCDAGDLRRNRSHYDVIAMNLLRFRPGLCAHPLGSSELQLRGCDASTDVVSLSSLHQLNTFCIDLKLTYQLSKLSFSRNFHVLLSW